MMLIFKVLLLLQYSQDLNKEGKKKGGKAGELIHLEYWESRSLARWPLRNYKIKLIIGKEEIYFVAVYIHKYQFLHRS